jgi:hydrogenase maturation protease
MVIGVGNPDRGDDAAGRRVARLMRKMLPHDVEVAEHEGEGAGLSALLEGLAAAFLVDACISDMSPGTVRRFDVNAAPLPQLAFGASTHAFGLFEAIELARALGCLPPRCVVYAIEGACFEIGAPLSPPVKAALPIAAERLALEVVGAADARGVAMLSDHAPDLAPDRDPGVLAGEGRR